MFSVSACYHRLAEPISLLHSNCQPQPWVAEEPVKEALLAAGVLKHELIQHRDAKLQKGVKKMMIISYQTFPLLYVHHIFQQRFDVTAVQTDVQILS